MSDSLTVTVLFSRSTAVTSSREAFAESTEALRSSSAIGSLINGIASKWKETSHVGRRHQIIISANDLATEVEGKRSQLEDVFAHAVVLYLSIRLRRGMFISIDFFSLSRARSGCRSRPSLLTGVIRASNSMVSKLLLLLTSFMLLLYSSASFSCPVTPKTSSMMIAVTSGRHSSLMTKPKYDGPIKAKMAATVLRVWSRASWLRLRRTCETSVSTAGSLCDISLSGRSWRSFTTVTATGIRRSTVDSSL
ncbi:hypothetical protein KC345_g136 [Hortaea werneckii]|nr:hypothetical protein KC345_g136 [Hortaea werneckii]